MNKLLLPLALLFLAIVSCKDSVVPKPDKLIDEDQMVAIIYDLSLLDAMKSQNTAALKYPLSSEFLKKNTRLTV